MVGRTRGNLYLMPRLRRECRGDDSWVARDPHRRRADPRLHNADEGAPPRPRIAAPSRTPVAGFGHLYSRHPDRKSTRLNSSHLVISYAVFCLKKKKKKYIM